MPPTNTQNARFVDLSHTLEQGLVTYKGLPAPIICDYLSHEESRKRYAPDTEFQIGKIDMVSNTGTYVDAPFHRFPNGKDLAELPLSSLADLNAVVVRSDISSERAIGPEAFLQIAPGPARPSLSTRAGAGTGPLNGILKDTRF